MSLLSTERLTKAFGALTVHALWRSGLTTSKRGAYAVPEGALR